MCCCQSLETTAFTLNGQYLHAPITHSVCSVTKQCGKCHKDCDDRVWSLLTNDSAIAFIADWASSEAHWSLLCQASITAKPLDNELLYICRALQSLFLIERFKEAHKTLVDNDNIAQCRFWADRLLNFMHEQYYHSRKHIMFYRLCCIDKPACLESYRSFCAWKRRPCMLMISHMLRYEHKLAYEGRRSERIQYLCLAIFELSRQTADLIEKSSLLQYPLHILLYFTKTHSSTLDHIASPFSVLTLCICVVCTFHSRKHSRANAPCKFSNMHYLVNGFSQPYHLVDRALLRLIACINVLDVEERCRRHRTLPVWSSYFDCGPAM